MSSIKHFAMDRGASTAGGLMEMVFALISLYVGTPRLYGPSISTKAASSMTEMDNILYTTSQYRNNMPFDSNSSNPTLPCNFRPCTRKKYRYHVR